MTTLHSTIAAQTLPFRLVHESGLPTDESLIHFNRSAVSSKLRNASSLHSKAQPMQNKPCGLLRNPKITGNLVGANTIAAIDQHPQSREPLVQRNRGILEDRSNLDGKLATALLALPAFLGGEVVMILA